MFRAERLLSDIFSKKTFFEFSGQDWGQTVSFEPLVIVNILKNFSSQKVTLGHFFEKFFFRISWPKWVSKVSILTEYHLEHIRKIESNIVQK